MHIGWFEVLFLLILGSGEPTTLEPLPAETIFEYLPAECEVIAFADFRDAGDGLDGYLDHWRDHVFLYEDAPDVNNGVDYLVVLRNAAKTTVAREIGLDPFTDLDVVSFCLSLEIESFIPSLNRLIVLQGDFNADVVRTVAASVGVSEMAHSSGETVYANSGDTLRVYSPAPGRILIGSSTFIEPFVGSGVTLTEPVAGSVNERLRDLSSMGVRRFVGFQPSTFTSVFLAGLGFISASSLTAGLEHVVLVGNDDIVMAEFQTRNEEALRHYELVTQGFGALLEAAPLLLEGFASLILGAAYETDTSWSEQAMLLAAHRDEVMTLLEGSGTLGPAIVTTATDTEAGTATLTLSESEGIQLLFRHILAIAYLTANNQLRETIQAFEMIPHFWSEHILPSLQVGTY